MSSLTPEQEARRTIDRLLEASGWIVQSRTEMNITAGLGVAVREFPLKTGFADYMLYVDGRASRSGESRKWAASCRTARM